MSSVPYRDSALMLDWLSGALPCAANWSDFPDRPIFEDSSLTPLHLWSASGENAKEMLHALSRGCNVDVVTFTGKTSLMIASSYGNEDIVSLLLNYGASVGVLDILGRDALMYACEGFSAEGFPEIDGLISVLLNARANPRLVSKDGVSACMLACASGHWGQAERLMSLGAPMFPYSLGGASFVNVRNEDLVGHLAQNVVPSDASGMAVLESLMKSCPPTEKTLPMLLRTCVSVRLPRLVAAAVSLSLGNSPFDEVFRETLMREDVECEDERLDRLLSVFVPGLSSSECSSEAVICRAVSLGMEMTVSALERRRLSPEFGGETRKNGPAL